MAKLKMKFSKAVLNGSGVREAMNSGGVQSELLSRAEPMADHAASFGGTYEADVRPGRSRAHALVKTKDKYAERANAKYNALLKSLDAGRG